MPEAWFVAAVTVATAVRHPRHSRSAWVLGLLVAAGAIAGALVAPPGRIPYGIGFGLVAGAGGWLVIVGVATLIVEAPAFARADRIVRIRDDRGRAVARIRTHGLVWRVSSVAAWPSGHGLGDAVMLEITRAADAAGASVELAPSSAPVARWYGQYGFVPCGRLLVRPPAAPNLSPAIGD